MVFQLCLRPETTRETVVNVAVWCFSCVSDLGMLIDTASTMSNSDLDAMPAQAFERHIEKIEAENKELARKLQGRDLC